MRRTEERAALARHGLDRLHQIIGVDEAGLGPLLGCILTAACIVPEEVEFPELNDSKQMSEAARESAYEKIIKDSNMPRTCFCLVVFSHFEFTIITLIPFQRKCCCGLLNLTSIDVSASRLPSLSLCWRKLRKLDETHSGFLFNSTHTAHSLTSKGNPKYQ